MAFELLNTSGLPWPFAGPRGGIIHAMYKLYGSSDSSDDEDPDTKLSTLLDMSGMSMDSEQLDDYLKALCRRGPQYVERFKTILLFCNAVVKLSPRIKQFENLKYLDMSSNAMTHIPPELCECPLATIIAKNNQLNENSLPPNITQMPNLKELNLSGNKFTRFPTEVLDLKNIKYFYIGGNKISEIPAEISRMKTLQVLAVGGNLLTEIPTSVGELRKLTALVLCDNKLRVLPREVARLFKLRSLLLHKNELTTLPAEIVVLRSLVEFSLRDNPLIVRSIADIHYQVPGLIELAARTIVTTPVDYSKINLPRCIVAYLKSGHPCMRTKCKGVYFETQVEHIKFVEFCGKCCVPLKQNLCSAACIDDENDIVVDEDLLKKVLLD